MIIDKSLVFSKAVMDASNLSGTITRIFSIILESGKEEPSNLTRFAMVSNLSNYSDGFSLLHLLPLKVLNQIQKLHSSYCLISLVFHLEIILNRLC